MKGLSRTAIAAHLGKPDFCEGPIDQTCETSTAWAYFFIKESDRPSGHGGGFPELVVTFDQTAIASGAECHYAK